eukprot:TRINITY_DN40719_c0_g1_i1.p1 TRINITY_DN40719_c0_g1~~TRINITY_DN40719_c0_g1_i1.p1  ORF type:complete len:443 (-),score=72.39 TRINITY_DN40719_c0_g1_i1:99-1427(-)
MAESRCLSCCYCCCCPFFFFCGAQRTILMFGAFVALLLALLMGHSPEILPDEVSELCEASMWFRDTDLSYITPSHASVHAWGDICREAFSSFDGETQRMLLALVPDGSHRKHDVLLDDGISGRTAAWNKDVQHWNETGKLQEAELPRFVEDLTEIPEAFARPEVVRFDSRKLLPREMFNATLDSVSALHPDTSGSTTIYGTMGGGSMCRLLAFGPVASLYPRIGRSALFWMLQHLSLIFERKVCPHPNRSLAHYARNPDELKKLGPSNINARRLPHFLQVDLTKALGLDGQAERTMSLAWLGVSPLPNGSLHTDVQDNILMELTSPTEVMIFPRTLFLNKSGERSEPYLYHRVILEPGHGIAIPSNFLHTVNHLEENRFGINSFFEPRLGAMQWGSGNYYYDMAQQSKAHLAMRALWFRSLGRLWEKRGIGMVMHGWKMEVL